MNKEKENKPNPIKDAAKDVIVFAICELVGGFIREVIIPKVKRLFGEKDNEDVDKPIVQTVGTCDIQETSGKELDKDK